MKEPARLLQTSMLDRPVLRIASVIVVAMFLNRAAAGAETLRDCSVRSRPTSYGSFKDTVKVEFLNDGRLVKLLSPVRYVDPCGTEWTAPAGKVVDGASIPRPAWAFAAPFEGKYRDASVIHDVACETQDRPWQLVHEVFYYAMLARSTATWKAKIMYAAVYHFGPRWADPTTNAPPPPQHLSTKEFETLKKTIRARESGAQMAAQPMSLNEIENWVPPPRR